MIVNKSMYPLQTGFSVISKMQQSMATLQMQLGTGDKASTLAGMGGDLPMSLSVRSRLSKIAGFSSNIETVNLRLSFLDKTMSRFDKIEGEARNSAIQGQYGTNNINMATLPDLSKARFDEVVTMLNADVAGRYLFGGSKTDVKPLPDTTPLLEGAGGKAGFKAVAGERKLADAGSNGQGRLQTSIDVGTGIVRLSEDGIHPFGMKVSTVSSSAPSSSVTVQQPGAGTIPLGNEVVVTFRPAPDAQITSGQTVTLGLALPDGTETQIKMNAVTAAEATGKLNEFVIGVDANATAANFQTALNASLVDVGTTTLAGASTYAAASNFFNGAGEPVLRVSGSPATATALRVATDTDTIMWYQGQSAAVSAEGLGRLTLKTAGDTSTLAQTAPVSALHGFNPTAISASTANITTTLVGGVPNSVSVQFTGVPVAGETVKVNLTQPDGTIRSVSLKAVTGKAGLDEFSIGTDANPVLARGQTAQAFSAALKDSVYTAAQAAEGNPRQSVAAQVDDSTKASYGMQADEKGFLRMIRTLGSLSVTTYPGSDASAKGRFDAMAVRQQSEMSESHNSERGSIEILTMELGVARGVTDNATRRHTDYKAQLNNLLSDVETVNKEDTAMQILALQTRLQASYQVTAMVSKLSLVNFM